jgi:hypothetical protein
MSSLELLPVMWIMEKKSLITLKSEGVTKPKLQSITNLNKYASKLLQVACVAPTIHRSKINEVDLKVRG